MSVAVEIGAGHVARPDFFEERYDEYYVVDSDHEKLAWGSYNATCLRPIHADAAKLDFADCSVDAMLARNVFGHATLGLDPYQESDWQVLKGSVKRGKAGWRARREFNRINTGIFEKKVAILHEAARILVEDGAIVMVDYYTPHEAATFFTQLSNISPTRKPRLSISEVALKDVASPGYGEHDDRSRVWVATK